MRQEAEYALREAAAPELEAFAGGYHGVTVAIVVIALIVVVVLLLLQEE